MRIPSVLAVLAASPFVLGALACGAPAESDSAPAPAKGVESPVASGPTTELHASGPIILPQVPCPSTWCGVSNACVTWTCTQPELNPGGVFTCTDSHAAAGTLCSDSLACITGGSCNGGGVCVPFAGGQEFCETTPRGFADGYRCGGCANGGCSATFGGNFVQPPAWACEIVTH
jgi:hypothetical protein